MALLYERGGLVGRGDRGQFVGGVLGDCRFAKSGGHDLTDVNAVGCIWGEMSHEFAVEPVLAPLEDGTSCDG